MQRLFCVSGDISKGKISILNKSQIHHIKDVLRLKIGDQLAVCDEFGNEYNSTIEELTAINAVLKIKEMKRAVFAEKIKVTFACAIPKKSKFDDIVDKLTQLGVDRIIPMLTQRVITKLDSHKEGLRLNRWKGIALSASEQSQRKSLPAIDSVKKIEEVLLEAENYDLKLIPVLIGERKTLKHVLSNPKLRNVLILIGPEGDFTPQELDLAKGAGFIPVTLGELVLRVETAAVSVASFIRFFYENR